MIHGLLDAFYQSLIQRISHIFPTKIDYLDSLILTYKSAFIPWSTSAMAEECSEDSVARMELPRSSIVVDISKPLEEQPPDHDVHNLITWVQMTEDNIPGYDGKTPLPYFGAYDDEIFSKYLQANDIASEEQARDLAVYYPLNLSPFGERLNTLTPGFIKF